MAAYSRQVAIDFGVLDLAGPRIAGFRTNVQLEYTTRMGVYALSRRVLDRYVPGLPYGEDDDQANLAFPLRRPTLIGQP